MNDARFEYRYTPLGYELYGSQGKKPDNDEQNNPQATVAKAEEYQTNFLNLPEGFKLGG